MWGPWGKSLLLVLLLAAALFGGAGRLDWPAGWALLGTYGAFVLLALLLVDPHLLRERAAPRPGFDRADAALASIGFLLLYPTAMAVGGLDAVRFGWGARPPQWLSAGGLGLFAAGYALALWAMMANRFFSTFVRIQSERGHSLVSTGPYATVRHPGYAGMLLAHLGMPLALGSWWAYAPVAVGGAVFVARILREERLLRASLPHYDRYQQSTRWRIVPGFW